MLCRERQLFHRVFVCFNVNVSLRWGDTCSHIIVMRADIRDNEGAPQACHTTKFLHRGYQVGHV